MFEVINLNESKILAKSLNVIIYGTIRDIEEHFVKSFTNIDILSNFFNNVYIIIFENDSTDNTRFLLNNWASYNNPNIIKKLILEENLNSKFPLRAHRLAYCRNKILNYIFENNLDQNYQYALHCDLDDRFWSLDYESILTCFQYDLNSWDGMFPINTNYTYYDYWALRCNETWFNKNIFCCEIENNENCKEFENHTSELSNFLMKNKNKLISVSSAFNGIGIYKLSSIKYSRYSANYHCSKCFGKNIGCYEDNDHIGLHKSMVFNNYKLFINTKMILENKNKNAISYSKFIMDLKNIPNIKKNVLKYVLYSKIIDSNSLWLNFSEKIGNYENTLSNFTSNKVFSFCNYDNDIYSNKLINDNVTKYVGNLSKNLYDFIIKNENDFISFMHIDFNNYHDTKNMFDKLYKKINNGCIIVINKFINFNEYLLNDLHAFYEFIQRYNIKFNYIAVNCDFSLKSINNGDTNVAIKIIENPNLSKIEITDKFFIYEDVYIYFDWKKYVENNDDLNHVKTIEEAWEHWYYHGKNECRKYYTIDNKDDKDNKEDDIDNKDNKDDKMNTILNIKNDFDWKTYIKINPDLKHLKNIEEAWNHWINYGKDEGRQCYTNNNNNNEKYQCEKTNTININSDFDWETYIKINPDLKHLKNIEEAWNHWINHGKDEGRKYSINDEKNDDKKDDKINTISNTTNDFDWETYIKINPDLKHLTTIEDAWNHWINHGINEGRQYYKKNEMYDNFDWRKYIKKNLDLNNIKNKEDAWTHWINHGNKEGRQIYLKKDDFNDNFDWEYYIENNKDLKHIKTKEEALNHWINYGINEGRNTINKNCINFSNFDWKYYIENNKDLKCIKTKEDAWDHWFNLGKHENRLFKKKLKKTHFFL